MHSWAKRSVSVLAIYAIALTTILSAFAAPPAAGATLDPFAVICHSGAPGAAQTDQGPSPASLPNHACDHCTLCNAAYSAAAPDFIIAGQFAPPSLLQVLAPASHDTRARLVAALHQARGPPRFA